MIQPEHNISWLIDDKSSTVFGGQTDKLKIEIPLPPEIGYGYSEHIHLPGGILLVQSRLFFKRNSKVPLPPKLPYGIFKSQFPSIVLLVHIVHKGKMECISKITEQVALRSSKTTLFQIFDKFNMEQNVYTKEDLAYTSIAIPQETLKSLVGDDLHRELLKSLRLSELGNPYANEINLPISITRQLKESLSDTLQKNLRALYAKSKILQFLLDVSLHSSLSNNLLETEETQIIAEKLYYYLINLDGDVPTLIDLAKKFGMNSIKLNNAFSTKYGESIYAFIMNLRLSQAHQALTSSTVPMKIISSRIGYSNVNNFIAAFKKKYGITPGSLRQI